MSTLSTRPPVQTTTPDSGARPARWAGLGGAGFVVCALTGNGIAGDVDLADAARPLSAQVGLGVEIIGLGLLIVFVGWLCATARPGLARTVAGASGAVTIAVKLGSGTALLAAWHEDDLGKGSVEALVAINDAAFVLTWMPFGLLIVAAAAALERAGLIGRVLRAAGLCLGGLTGGLGVIGSAEPTAAVPIPFLLSLVWLVVATIRAAGAGRPLRRE